MLTTNLEKVDKFFIVLALVLIVMSILLVFSFRGVFSLFLTAYDFDPDALAPAARVNSENLDQAYNWVKNRQIVTLNQGI